MASNSSFVNAEVASVDEPRLSLVLDEPGEATQSIC